VQVGDRLLKEILVLLSWDEARHFSFFADMIRLYLERYGEVISGFRMPLPGTIKGYWRWALKIADTARHDHTEEYEHLVKVVNPCGRRQVGKGRRARRLRQRVPEDSGRHLASILPEGIYCQGHTWWGDYVCD
jgi:hypothetical protein